MKKIALPTAIAVIIILIGAGVFFLSKIGSGPGPYDVLAKCLKEKGVKMYGAWWCPHCQAQKKTFGSSFKYINYIECAIGESGQTKECKDTGIESYPTWIFPDGKRETGEQSPESLGQQVSCKV